ncbi:MAG: AAA family ATPase [Betaproteobacteria bacterium]|nr:AAA family ATPase [Betaproteobacteria bacterium]
MKKTILKVPNEPDRLLPPAQHRFEQSVLGALLLPGSNAIDRIGHLKPGHFFTEAHRIIFGEIVAMAAQAMAVDPVTVAERLESSGLSDKTGGLVYLGDLASNTPSAASCGHYAKIVIDKALERELVSAADKIQSIAAGLGSTREKMTDAQSAIMQITESAEPQKPKHIREVLIRAVAAIERRGDGSDNAMATGFHALDQKLSGGFRRGNLVVVAGRPGMGKTALAGCLAYSAASNGIPTLFISMEMQDTELADRLIAIAGRVPLDDILAGNMEGDVGDRIVAGTARLHELPLVIDEQGGLSFFDIASKARSVRRQHGLGLLIIDYLQLASGDGDNRNSQIEGITRGLKALAQGIADTNHRFVAAQSES